MGVWKITPSSYNLCILYNRQLVERLCYPRIVVIVAWFGCYRWLFPLWEIISLFCSDHLFSQWDMLLNKPSATQFLLVEKNSTQLEPYPDSKVHGANMGPWVLSAPDGSHVGPMNLAIRDIYVVTVLPLYPISIQWDIHSGIYDHDTYIYYLKHGSVYLIADIGNKTATNLMTLPLYVSTSYSNYLFSLCACCEFSCSHIYFLTIWHWCFIKISTFYCLWTLLLVYRFSLV